MKKASRKVYCLNCRYLRYREGYICSIKPEIIDLWDHKRRVYASPKKRNKNNDCPYYKRRWWKFWV